MLFNRLLEFGGTPLRNAGRTNWASPDTGARLKAPVTGRIGCLCPPDFNGRAVSLTAAQAASRTGFWDNRPGGRLQREALKAGIYWAVDLAGWKDFTRLRVHFGRSG
jgi:hypothetical protein